MSGTSSNFRGGTAFFKIDGTQYDLLGSFSVDIGGLTKTAVAGADGMHGYTSKYRPPMIEAEVSGGSGFSLKALGLINNSTITFELDTGQTYVLYNGWIEGDWKLDAGEAKSQLKFSGMGCEEL